MRTAIINHGFRLAWFAMIALFATPGEPWDYATFFRARWFLKQTQLRHALHARLEPSALSQPMLLPQAFHQFGNPLMIGPG
jgi:hypothetical protein